MGFFGNSMVDGNSSSDCNSPYHNSDKCEKCIAYEKENNPDICELCEKKIDNCECCGDCNLPPNKCKCYE